MALEHSAHTGKDGLIKIGTTTNVAERMRVLGVVAPLVTEQGSYELETKRLRQFNACKAPIGREYFYPSAELMAHIESLQHQHARQWSDSEAALRRAR